MFLASYKSLVVGGFHKFYNIVSGIVIFIIDLGVAEEAGVSPLFENCCGDVKLLHDFLVGEYHFTASIHTFADFANILA